MSGDIGELKRLMDLLKKNINLNNTENALNVVIQIDSTIKKIDFSQSPSHDVSFLESFNNEFKKIISSLEIEKLDKSERLRATLSNKKAIGLYKSI